MRRFLLLAISVAVASVCATTAALVTFNLSLPPSDGAYGQSIWMTLKDPFVRLVLIQVAGIGWLLSLPIAAKMLWRTRMIRSVPVVAGVTIVAAFASGPLNVFAAIPTLVTGVLSMIWCRKRYPREGERSVGA